MLSEIILTVILFYIIFRLYQKKVRPPGFPPGPPILPILGSLPFMGSDPTKTFTKWRTKYGDIVGLKMGFMNLVILNGHDLIKEAYSEMAFSGRMLPPSLEEIINKNKKGLTQSEGQEWIEQRRFALRNLRDFGFGKKSMEGMAHEDITDLLAVLKKDAGQSISTENKFSISGLNALWHIVTGHRFALDDKKFQDITEKLQATQGTKFGALTSLALFIPWLGQKFPDITGISQFKKAHPAARALIQEYIDEHKNTYQEDNMRDFIDVYLKEMYNTTDPQSSFYKETGDENLLYSCMNLFEGGSGTTTGTLNWVIYYLTKNLDIQQKLQKEIEDVVGSFRLPSLNDRPNMPYTEAVMLETFRMSSLLPFSVPHSMMEDVVFKGYNIPKDTTVFANLIDIHYDDKIWGDPETFRPERFLTNDGKQIDKSHPPVVPFSIGRRFCPGETLARNNFFLFLTSIYQRFNIARDGTPEKPSLGDIIRIAPHINVIFEDRLDKVKGH